MQTTYAQKNETVQKASANTAESVVDSSSQSATLQRHASLANAAVQRAENPPRPNNTGLPDDLKNGVESLSGYSLDNVRVHYNSPKPATVQALAYTQGTDIHVAPGQEHALPHEAWHVTQQMAGRVTPTTNIGGMPVNDNAALEHEADVMGEKAVTQRKVDGSASTLKSVNLNGGSVQRMPCVCSNGKEENVTTCNDLVDAFENGEKKVEGKKKSRVKKIKTIGDANVDEVNGRARVFKLLKKENINLSRFDALVEENDKFDGFITGLSKDVINDNLIKMPCYWMDWTAHCTGDLPSMAAAIMMGLPQGIKIKNGGKFKPQDKLNEVASYFGGSIVDGTEVIDSDGFLVATADVKVNSLTVKNGGKKFSWLTNVVATGKYETRDQNGNITYSEKVSNHGLDKDGIGRIKKTWIGDIDGKANAMNAFLGKYGLTPDKLDKLNGKNVEILWIRKSGEGGGAHYENDTSFNAVENYIKTSSQSGKIFILAGDEKDGKAEKIASRNADVVYNLTAFWKNDKETVAAWGGNTRTGQLGIYEYIKNRVGSGSLKHIGSMSGGLEALALIGHEVKYKAKDGEIGVDRVGKYEKKRKNNAVNYSKNDFFELGKGKKTNGYEKRSAKYFNLFSNMSPGFSRNKVIGIYRNKTKDWILGDDDVYKICFKAFLKNSFLKKLETSGFDELFLETSKTNSQLNGIPQEACVEMAKKFAKAEKSLNENAVNAKNIFESVEIDDDYCAEIECVIKNAENTTDAKKTKKTTDAKKTADEKLANMAPAKAAEVLNKMDTEKAATELKKMGNVATVLFYMDTEKAVSVLKRMYPNFEISENNYELFIGNLVNGKCEDSFTNGLENEAFVLSLMAPAKAAKVLNEKDPAEAATVLFYMDTKKAVPVLTFMYPKFEISEDNYELFIRNLVNGKCEDSFTNGLENEAFVLSLMAPAKAAKVLNEKAPAEAAKVLNEMDSAKAVLVLNEMAPAKAAEVLHLMKPEKVVTIMRLVAQAAAKNASAAAAKAQEAAKRAAAYEAQKAAEEAATAAAKAQKAAAEAANAARAIADANTAKQELNERNKYIDKMWSNGCQNKSKGRRKVQSNRRRILHDGKMNYFFGENL